MNIKIATITAIILFFVAQTSFSQTYKISIDAKNAKNGKIQFGYYYDDQQLLVQKITLDDKGQGILTDTVALRKGLYFIAFNQSKFFDLIIDENQTFSIKTDTSNLIKKTKFTGTKINTIFLNYQQKISTLNIEKTGLLEKSKQKIIDTTEFDRINHRIIQIDKIQEEMQQEISDKYPESFLTSLLKASAIPDITQFDFDDERLIISPFLYKIIRRHIAKFINYPASTIIIETDRLINKTKNNEKIYQYTISYLLNFYNSFYKIGMNEIFAHVANTYFLPNKVDWITLEHLASLSERVERLSASFIGKSASELKMESTTGEFFSLLEVNTPTTFLYFWSSNCGHCENSSAILKKHYQELIDHKIEIFAVSTDSRKSDFIEAVENNEYEWINCIDINNTTNFRELYYVVSSPILYVIDKDKKIIGKYVGEIEIENLVKRSIR